MKFLADWQDGARNVSPEERATVADLKIILDDRNVTLHLRGEKSADHVTITLYSLAEGLAYDWWSLFGGRDRKLSLLRHRSGFAVPDIRLSFDGAVFEASAHQHVYRNPDIRFWAGPTEVMDRQAAEAELDGLITAVMDRLKASGLPESSACQRWRRVLASRDDVEETAFCEAAGALGMDPYAISDEAADLIERAGKHFDREPLTEFLAGAGSANRNEMMRWIDTVEHRPAYKARIGDLGSLAKAACKDAPPRSLEASWALGYRRARTLRHLLNLGADHRFGSFKKLAKKLGASENYELAGHVNGLRALRNGGADDIRIHMRNQGKSDFAHASHLFTFARAVGDAICFPQGGNAPVNDLHSAYRQSAGRAFAAEFLAPINEVRSMHEDGRDAVSIAEDLGVATTVIELQWENRERIDTACAPA